MGGSHGPVHRCRARPVRAAARGLPGWVRPVRRSATTAAAIRVSREPWPVLGKLHASEAQGDARCALSFVRVSTFPCLQRTPARDVFTLRAAIIFASYAVTVSYSTSKLGHLRR